MEFKTTGKNTINIVAARDKEGRLCFLAECFSQYGWQDGCQDRNPVYAKLATLKCIKHNYGSPFYCGNAAFEGEVVNIKDYTNIVKLGYGTVKAGKKYDDICLKLTCGEAEKLGLIEPCFPKGKVKTNVNDLSLLVSDAKFYNYEGKKLQYVSKGTYLYFPKRGSNKYYRARRELVEANPANYISPEVAKEFDSWYSVFFHGIIDGIEIISRYFKYEDSNDIDISKAVLLSNK